MLYAGRRRHGFDPALPQKCVLDLSNTGVLSVIRLSRSIAWRGLALRTVAWRCVALRPHCTQDTVRTRSSVELTFSQKNYLRHCLRTAAFLSLPVRREVNKGRYNIQDIQAGSVLKSAIGIDIGHAGLLCCAVSAPCTLARGTTQEVLILRTSFQKRGAS